MENKKLHIISFDIPYPANYGGVIDVYHKLLILSKLGVKIILHCFKYGDRKKAAILEEICEQVFYYPRLKFLAFPASFSKPYIVASRKNTELLKNLQSDNAPILFEGLHTCYYLNHGSLRQRKKLVRMHNIEWEYYHHLAKNEKNILKKIHFKFEANLLKKFEQNLTFSSHILAISQKDFSYLNKLFSNVKLLSVFSENEQLTCKLGFGEYVLYHGNLSVNENIKAVEFILEIYETNNLVLPLVIAGKNPSEALKNRIKKAENIKLVANPSNIEINKFIEDAHINFLPTFQATGIKLKLINALFKGRFCLVNNEMISGTNLADACITANNKEAFIEALKTYTNLEFSEKDIKNRMSILANNFDNNKNAKKLYELI